MTACKNLVIFIDYPDAPFRDNSIKCDKYFVVDAVD